MKSKNHILPFALALTLLAGTTSGRGQVAATLTTVYSFPISGNASPNAGLIQGSDGNFYGTTSGTIFQLTPAGALTTLHYFTYTPDFENGDGAYPNALIQVSGGSFYGTTLDGGIYGSGIFYKISSDGTIAGLHAFGAGTEVGNPVGALTISPEGGFYGATSYTVFRITPAGDVTTIFVFSNSGQVSPHLNGGLALDANGNLYGTTFYSGTDGNGTVFRVTPGGEMTILHSFSAADEYGANSDGANPGVGLILGSDGYFYGTTTTGGTGALGTVFKMTPDGELTTLHNFGNAYLDLPPSAGLIEGSDGNFYGTTGVYYSYIHGSVFQITPGGTFTTVYRFSGSDGSFPLGLIQGSDGSFYGPTYAGGTDNFGTIFKLTVTATQHPAFFNGEAALANGVYYLALPGGNPFGYYSYLTDPNYIYHFDLGYEYLFDAADGKSGVYFYDFKSNGFFYSSPGFPFPYLYDFSLNSVVYYYPDPKTPGHYNTNGVRYFYVFNTGQIILEVGTQVQRDDARRHPGNRQPANYRASDARGHRGHHRARWLRGGPL